MDNAELMWIKLVQHKAYPELYTSLLNNNKCYQPLVRQLYLFIDKQGLIRCGGRIHNADIDYTTKFPILLPTYHYYTAMVIRNEHSRTLHGGTQATVTYLRQRYWIPHIRRAVNQIVNKCVICRRVVGKSYARPISAPLQEIRVKMNPPFRSTMMNEHFILCLRN
ncbi:uncharacterized protein LOC144344394 [Saccoglossus kowalevskii]